MSYDPMFDAEPHGWRVGFGGQNPDSEMDGEPYPHDVNLCQEATELDEGCPIDDCPCKCHNND